MDANQRAFATQKIARSDLQVQEHLTKTWAAANVKELGCSVSLGGGHL